MRELGEVVHVRFILILRCKTHITLGIFALIFVFGGLLANAAEKWR